MKQQMDEKELQTVEESLMGIESELVQIGCMLGTIIFVIVFAIVVLVLV